MTPARRLLHEIARRNFWFDAKEPEIRAFNKQTRTTIERWYLYGQKITQTTLGTKVSSFRKQATLLQIALNIQRFAQWKRGSECKKKNSSAGYRRSVFSPVYSANTQCSEFLKSRSVL
jgi:hypothetical protein